MGQLMVENCLEDIANTDDIFLQKYESLSVRRSVDKQLCIFATVSLRGALLGWSSLAAEVSLDVCFHIIVVWNPIAVHDLPPAFLMKRPATPVLVGLPIDA